MSSSIKAKPQAIEYLDPGDLKAHPRNTNLHGPRQIEALQKSLKEFGFVKPVIVDEHDVILAGHGITTAARRMRMKTIPVVRKTGLSEAQKRAYVIADNKLAELSEWDDEMLEIELSDLAEVTDLYEAMGFTDRPAAKELDGSIDAASYGGATALQRSSAPLRSWEKAGLVNGDVLDFGCGHEDAGHPRFDPFHAADYSLLLRRYQTVLCSYVLNVQPADHLILEVLLVVYKLVAPSGCALIAVRNDLEVGRHQSQRGVQIIKTPPEWEAYLAHFFTFTPLEEAQDYLHWLCKPIEGPQAP